jgi:hypothetical protein
MTPVDKTLQTPRPLTRTDPKQAAAWAEARSVYPIYLAVAKHFDFGLPFATERRTLPEGPPADVALRVLRWLDEMDQQVQVYQLRHVLQTTTLNASEESLRSLIFRHLHKPHKTNEDRDKIDFLLVQYFVLCAPAKIYHKQIELADVALVLHPILGDTDPTPLDWCEPLEKMIVALQGFRSLRDILRTRFIEQGRKVKDAAGGMFYDPCALLAFVRFNFLLRRTFIELMHADLIAIRAGLNYLGENGVQSIPCSSFEGAHNTVPFLKQFVDAWKQPFQAEYTETSVHSAFERLLALRADVEKALETYHSKASTGAPSGSRWGTAGPAPVQATKHPSAHPPVAALPQRQATTDAPPAALRAAKPVAVKPARPPQLSDWPDFEGIMEKIWEQLVAAPPSHGRSMTTVKIGAARILMSSWEVAAFLSDEGPPSEDLRRAVVARVMVTTALETAKETGNATGLERAREAVRAELSRLQERVEAAKRAKNTEAAVNLGISTKRLVSVLDEAERL